MTVEETILHLAIVLVVACFPFILYICIINYCNLCIDQIIDQQKKYLVLLDKENKDSA